MGLSSTLSATGELTIRFDGAEIKARPGDTIAAALIANGIGSQGTAKNGEPRGVFCGMGVCHDCLVTVDGQAAVRSCMTKASDGMVVERHYAKPAIASGYADLAAVPEGPLAQEEVDILVVGAGPGGLASALAAADAGTRVLIVDERPAPGGQYYKQPATRLAIPESGPDAQSRAGADLIASVQDRGVEIRGETLIWGAFREQERLIIGVIRQGRASYLLPRMTIIATGAFEQPGIFPGWTLPGVLTTGACQTLLRSYGVIPGKTVLVAGNGPLNLQVAAELARAGATVAGVAEAAPAPWQRPAASLALMAADPALAIAGTRYLAELQHRGIPIKWQHRLSRVEGTGRAERAVLIDPAGGEHVIAVDAICITEGFAPANELVRILGCDHAVSPSGFARLEVIRDEAGATSLRDVFVVGEAGGFGGAHIAMAQGRLAGREAARRIGHDVPEDPRARRSLLRQRRFQKALWQVFATEEAGLSRASDETILCRCEALMVGEVRHAIEERGIVDLATLKRLTRAGMGRCQGRYCMPRLAGLLERPQREADFPAPQMPLRPVPLAALAVEKPEWGGHRRALLPPAGRLPVKTPLEVGEASVVVIGAGIVGLSTALFLAREGADVVVIDRGHPNARASGGNAGSLHAQLLSFDHGSKAEGGGSAAARTLPLQRDAIMLWQQLEQEVGRDFEIKITGGLMVAETAKDLEFLAAKTRVERQYGIDCDIISGAELRAMEPALDDFIGAAYCPQEGKINPLVATHGILDAAIAAGARIISQADVTAISRAGRDFVVHTHRGTIRTGRVVNAAGAFASQIGRMLERDVPVFGAPLQMIVTEAVEPMISRLVAHADRHLTLKQAANGNFIIGGGWTADLDPVHRHPRPLRASLEGNLWVAQRVVPALRKLNVIRSWAAMNINIDGAPLLGEDPGIPGFFNAVTSNGYTLGPLVGRITADLVLHGETDRDVQPFSITRFHA
jgi:glycine/D-amino acid oxidase-like deaminating enzyme